jgi:flagellar biosynthesis/type III secretory pathway M-ring protein FliF/YscJ
MAPATTAPLPGSMTVPPLFGWEFIAVVLLVAVAVAVAFFLMAAAGRNVSERAEMQAWLEARSSGRRQEPTEVRDAAQAPAPE